MKNTTDNQKNSKVINKGKNPNHFPEETLSNQRELPNEGDDKKGAMEDGAANQPKPGAKKK